PPERGPPLGNLLPRLIVKSKRTMVRGEGVEDAAGQSAPDRLLRGAIARRRRTDIFRARKVHVEAFEVLRRQHQILGACFGVDLEASPSRPLDLLHRLAPGYMHDHDRNADQLGVRDRAMRRLTLDELGPRFCMIVRLGLAVALEAI